MDIELLTFGGYGQFVWPAFIFTFVCCFFLYLKTKKELQKLEEKFLNEFNEFQAIKIEVTKQKKASKEVLSANSTF